MTIVVAIMASVFIFMGSQICIVNNRINQTPIQTVEAVVHTKEIETESRWDSSSINRISNYPSTTNFIVYLVTENEKDGVEIHRIDNGEVYESFNIGDRVLLDYKQIRDRKVIVKVRKLEHEIAE
jgi:hypothetical protein